MVGIFQYEIPEMCLHGPTTYYLLLLLSPIYRLLSSRQIGEYLVETDQYPSGPLITKLVNEFISKDDKDGDKRVSFEEFTGPKFDTDGSRHDEL